MNIEIKKELADAQRLYKNKKYKEAFEIFDKNYKSHPEEMKRKDKDNYAWSIYYLHVQHYTDENELIENVEKITEIVRQKDLNRYSVCIYTFAIFKVITHFKNLKDFYSMVSWLEKLDPKLLDVKKPRANVKFKKRRKELYYYWASKAYLECGEYEKCIEISREALNVLKNFRDDGNIWYYYRIAKSLKYLNKLNEALVYFKKVIRVQKAWYIYREIVEIYYMQKNKLEALKYACPAVLSDEPVKSKTNLYYLIYKILKSSKPELALKHAELYYVLRAEQNHSIPFEIESLISNPQDIYKLEVISEIENLWIQYKKSQDAKND